MADAAGHRLAFWNRERLPPEPWEFYGEETWFAVAGRDGPFGPAQRLRLVP